jgi:hypothetical protein
MQDLPPCPLAGSHIIDPDGCLMSPRALGLVGVYQQQPLLPDFVDVVSRLILLYVQDLWGQD